MFFIHYKHTQLIVSSVHFRRSNCVSFYLGLLSGVGLLLIASFQVNINAYVNIHNDYTLCNSVCTCRMEPLYLPYIMWEQSYCLALEQCTVLL